MSLFRLVEHNATDVETLMCSSCFSSDHMGNISCQFSCQFSCNNFHYVSPKDSHFDSRFDGHFDSLFCCECLCQGREGGLRLPGSRRLGRPTAGGGKEVRWPQYVHIQYIYILIYTCMYVYIIIFYTSIIDSYIHYIYIVYIHTTQMPLYENCNTMSSCSPVGSCKLLSLCLGEAWRSLAKLGEALASLQWRYLEVINRHDCDASLPDINGDRWDGRSRTDCGSTKCRLMHHIRNI